MMRSAFASVLMLTVAGGAYATETRSIPGFAVTKPKPEWHGIALVVIDLEASDRPAPGYYCPPESDEPETDGIRTICLGASMFDQDGSIRRVLAATPDFGVKRYGTFRTIGGHAARATKGGQYIALIEQTSDGYTWVPWQAPIVRGQACLSQSVVKTFSIIVPPAATMNENGERCFKAQRSF